MDFTNYISDGVDTSAFIPNNSEGVDIREDTIRPKMDLEEFGLFVKKKLVDIETELNDLKIPERQKVNFKYWKGDQVDASQLRDDLESEVENIVFENLETFLPIATARTPEPSMTVAYKNEYTRAYARDVKNTLMAEYEVYQNMAIKLTSGIRNHQLNLLGAFKYGYDEDTGEFWTEEVYATNLRVSKDGKFVYEYIRDKTLGDLLELFPERKAAILNHLGYNSSMEPTKKILDSPVTYGEAWSEKWVGWMLDTLPLGLERNPHFDYEGKTISMPTGRLIPDEYGRQVEEMEEKTVYYNQFKTPRIPYLFLRYFNRGISIYDDTTLVEQAIGPQNRVNKRKRQIGENADSMNGTIVSSKDYFSEGEFEKLEGGINEKILLSQGDPHVGINKIFGPEMPQFVYNDMLDSRAAADNLFGTHSTTRGQKSGNNTLGQDVLQKDQDYGRVDGYVRNAVESFAKEWFEAMYHMYLVYQTEEKSIAVPEEDDFENDNVIFSRERVPIIQKKDGSLIVCPLLILVKQGSTLPKDELAEYQKAKDQKEMLSPLDYFKKTNEPNPKELAKNALLWAKNPYAFFKGDPDIEELMRIEQQNAMMAAGANMQAGGQPQMPAQQQPQLPPDAVMGQPPQQGGSSQGVQNALTAIIRGDAGGDGGQQQPMLG